MAEESCKKLKVKNTNINRIFETMEYGKVSDSTSLSKSWLKKQQKEIIYTYIDKRVEISKGVTTEIKDVNNRELLATIYSPNSQDVEKIISKSVEDKSWSLTGANERAVLLERLAREIDRNSTLFCQLEISVRGILSKDTKAKGLPLLNEYLQYYASWAVKYKKENPNWKPKGITVSVISDESSLAVFGFVLGPALAAGYNVLLQTEPKISVIAALIIEIAENVGIPEGVIKLMPSPVDLGPLLKHNDVMLVSSFGNLHANKYNLAKPLGKKFVAISNGGKSPMIVFNNADLDSACDSIVDAAWGYGGMLPWSINTVIVQEDIFHTFMERLKYRLSKVKIGPATDKVADVSYPVAADAAKQLQLFINEAKLQGIKVYQNNPELGTFQPTLLIGGRVFGNNVILDDINLPLVTVLPFRTSNEAVSLANNTRYGFSVCVWTENIGLANEVAGKLAAGNVWINSYGNFSAAAPVTPLKESGIGYFGGEDGFFEYVRAENLLNLENKRLIKKSNLPEIAQNNPLQSFYAGSSRKSESGLIDGVFDHPVQKDLYNAIAGAKKGHEVWSKITLLNRNQLLRKVADEINCNKTSLSKNTAVNEHTLDSWISTTYEGAAQLTNLGNTFKHKSYMLHSSRQAAGVIAVEEPTKLEDNFISIIGALLLGNSVIILNCAPNFSLFYLEIGKIFSICNVPAGAFNVILNCNDDLLHMVAAHKELSAYFMCTANEIFDRMKVKALKRFYPMAEDWSQVIAQATEVKNVWFNVGNSVV